MPTIAFSLFLLGTAWLFDFSNVLALLWAKGIFLGLLFGYKHYFDAHEYYFYYNLGVPKRVLFLGAFLTDGGLFVLLYQLLL